MIPLLLAGGAAASIGGSIFSGIMGKSAAKKQEEMLRQAQAKAEGVTREFSDRSAGWLRSFRDRGDTAQTSLQDILSGKMNIDDMVGQSSLFKFQREEGTRNINRQLRARGLYGSGAGLETLAKFETQLTGQEGRSYMEDLFRLSEQGLRAGSQLAQQDISTGNTLADLAMRGGMAQANSRYQGDMSIAGLGKDIGNAIAGGVTGYAQYNMMEPFLKKMAGGAPAPAPTDGFDEAGMHQEDLGRYIMQDAIMDYQLPRRAPTPPQNEYSMAPTSNWSTFP